MPAAPEAFTPRQLAVPGLFQPHSSAEPSFLQRAEDTPFQGAFLGPEDEWAGLGRPRK